MISLVDSLVVRKIKCFGGFFGGQTSEGVG